MAIIELNLPEQMKAAVEARAIAAGYDSVDHYITSLIEADEIAPISDSLEAEILRGLDSGPSAEITPDFVANLRSRAKHAV